MRVCIVPEYPMSLMTGGLQVQAKETYRGLLAVGQDAELFSWSDERPIADVYHFMGFPRYMSRISQLVREARRPYVITMLFGGKPSLSSLWMAKIRQNLKSRILRQRELFDAVCGASKIVTITKGDAEAVKIIFGYDIRRVHVVENGVTEPFFKASPEAWHQTYGTEPFVLCVGAIQPRKNQLLLAQACNQAALPLVLLGPVLPGEKSYSEQVSLAMAQNQKYGGRWLTDLRNEDPLLPSAYAACGLFALLSRDETQPLSVMQAMAAKKPVLLLKAPYSADPLYSSLPSVDSHGLPEVVSALKKSWTDPASTSLSDDYTWEAVAASLQKIYSTIPLERC